MITTAPPKRAMFRLIAAVSEMIWPMASSCAEAQMIEVGMVRMAAVISARWPKRCSMKSGKVITSAARSL